MMYCGLFVSYYVSELCVCEICVLSNTKLKKEYRIGTFYRHKIIKEREMWTKNLIKLMISRERKTR
jgi:hypothetical protein